MNIFPESKTSKHLTYVLVGILCITLPSIACSQNARNLKEMIGRHFDADGDGRLSSSERKTMKQHFAAQREKQESITIDEWENKTSKEVYKTKNHSSYYKLNKGTYSVSTAKHFVLNDRSQNKDIQLRITYPETKGKYPLIIWSHGAYGSKDNYMPLVTYWAMHGYIVIQANHTDSRKLNKSITKNSFKDWESRIKDVVFIIDSLTVIEEKQLPVNIHINQQQVGVGGHSFGAHTSQILGGAKVKRFIGKSRSLAEKRLKSFLLVSPQGTGKLMDEESWKDFTAPAMIITGTRDSSGRTARSYTWRLEAYNYMPSTHNKHLGIIQNADHGFGGISGGFRISPSHIESVDHVNAVRSMSLAFFDAYIKNENSALSFLKSSRFMAASNNMIDYNYK